VLSIQTANKVYNKGDKSNAQGTVKQQKHKTTPDKLNNCVKTRSVMANQNVIAAFLIMTKVAADIVINN